MNNWAIFGGVLIYTIVLLAFIYYFMGSSSSAQSLLFRLPKDQVFAEKSTSFDLVDVPKTGKYFDAKTKSIVVPRTGVWNVALNVYIKGGSMLRYIEVYVNDKLWNLFEASPQATWKSFTASFGLSFKAGDKIRIAGRSNGSFEVNSQWSFVTLSQ